ncbi:glycosyltransferase family 1 [Bifidobacterium animalis subsp. animalis]|uniref:glycosyltransferase family 4 protein n=1 Tax=Bifidobacterium animalis TaxID=28025 RepID=UPI001020BA22|nr:glycosyltransferase family 4 protein [Bifidobacterium animalis]RYN12187.1 glycosyltransferase family 1 [Bifidobacterium animalis subsp. animalis]
MVTFFINDISGRGGTERVTCSIANMLATQGEFPIEILSLHQTKLKTIFDLSPNIPAHTLFNEAGHGITRFPATWLRLHKYLKTHKVDILVDVDGILDLYSFPAAIGTSTKIISWEHFNYFSNPTVPYRKLSRPLAGRFASALVTLTEKDKQNYLDNLKHRKSPVISITNPMPPFQKHPYNVESRTIVSAGRLTDQKGFDLLLESAFQVLPKHPDWQWYILGEGEDRKKLEKMVNDYGLSAQVHLPGMVKIDDYLKDASFFVLSSRYEGLGMVLLEAKAHHLPLISFDCEIGPAEIIENGVNGILVPPEDTDALAHAVEKFIDSPSLRQQYSDKSEQGSERFQPEYILNQWTNLLRHIQNEQ